MMHKVVLVFTTILLSVAGVSAQSAGTLAGASSSTSASHGKNNVRLESGTQLSGTLQSALDARKAHVEDQVVLKTTENIKSGGQVVVKKGARLIGHVTSVAQKTRENNESHIGVLFDQLQSGSLSLPISATITSITQAQAQMQGDAFGADSSSMARGSGSVQGQQASGGSGGLLGGVTNTATSAVGGVVNGATTAVGSTVDSATGAAGETISGVGRSLGRIQIAESSSTQAEGGSMLSLNGDNLKLDKGVTFKLLVSQSGEVGAGRN